MRPAALLGSGLRLPRRRVQAAEIDTVIDTRLVVDAIATSRSAAHENNVIGTLNILAACFPDREIVGIHAVDLVWGLGTLHCLSQQEPA